MTNMAASAVAVQPPGPPLWLLAEVTYRCPLHCVFCYNPLDFAAQGKAQELPTADWLRVLREARCAEDSEAVVRADLMYLALRLGKPVLVVTHVDAERADGRRIAARVRHVARIKAAARGLHQVHVIDPLDAAPDWPSARLLASDGADMNHYSPYMHTRIRAALAASSGALAPSQFLPEYQDGP